MLASQVRRRLLGVGQRVAIRSGRGRLSWLWPRLYGAIERRIAAFLLRGRDGSAYVRGGTGRDQPLWGVSDIDLFCVVAGAGGGRGRAREAVLGRWRWLRTWLPFIDAIVSVGVYEDEDLADSVAATYLTHGLEAPASAPLEARALYYDDRPGLDHAWLRARPGLFGPVSDWRLVSGSPRLPPVPEQDATARRIAAWADLQHWWLYAFARCADPTHPTTSYLAAKLIVEPVRILLWIRDGEKVWRRPDVIELGLERLPEHRTALLLARDLIARPLGPGDRGSGQQHSQALNAAFPHFVELSKEVARTIDAGIEGARTPVRLLGRPEEIIAPPGESGAGSGGPEARVPLCDWRVLCIQRWPDAAMRVLDEELSPESVATAVASASRGDQPVLDAGDGLLVMPAPETLSQIRRVVSPFSDPVSTALLGDVDHAAFAPARGYAAADWARRAVAERGAQIAAARSDRSLRSVGLLFAAARAALFAESLSDRDPALALTATATGERLIERYSRRRASIEACLEACRSLEETVPQAAVTELGNLVTSLFERCPAMVAAGSRP